MNYSFLSIKCRDKNRLDKFNIIYKIIRKISEEYEGTW